jgi:hypothetical protein
MAMAFSSLNETDQNVLWFAEWRKLRARLLELRDRSGAAEESAIDDQIFELEERIAATRATTRAGVLAQLEVGLASLDRDGEGDRLEARLLRNAIAALAAGVT